MAAGAVIALVGIAGCGGAGSGSADVASAASGFNGPFGLGGPFEGGGIAAAGPASTANGNSGSKIQVDHSTALAGVTRTPWLFTLGAGIKASAPQVVRPGIRTPADAAAGFYQAFYDQRFTAACGYVAPAQRARCPLLLRESGGSADVLHTPAIGFAVVKGSEALVTMTGVLCRAASGCVGQHNPHWIFDHSHTFDQLWALSTGAGGNPLTVTPLTKDAGHWYVDLTAVTAAR